VDDLFDFLFDANNYEERKVERYEKDGLFVDTCEVSDQPEPYKFETAVAHPEYCNDDEMVIVQLYESEAEAILGHNKWVKLMTSKKLPDQLIDVSDIGLTKILDELEEEGENGRIFKRNKEVDK